MERYMLCVVLAVLSLSQAQQHHVNYEYDLQTHAFYKLHGSANKSRAQEICRSEGAQLMIVTSNLDVARAVSMLKRDNGVNYARVEAERGTNNLTEDTTTYDYGDVCKVVTKAWKVQSHECSEELPFICKVNASDVNYDSRCQVYSRDYTYVAETNSCYKLYTTPLTWDQANNKCTAEGAHLVIINSLVENLKVLQMWLSVIDKSDIIYRLNYWYWFYAGFKADNPDDGTRVFRTVLNQTLEEAGYVNWEPNEPNNAGGNEYCGAIYYKNGKFNDVNCSFKLVFICEKNIESLALK